MNLNKRVNNTDAVYDCIKNSDRFCFSSRSISKHLNDLNVYQIADGLRQLQRDGKIIKYNKRNWVLKKD